MVLSEEEKAQRTATERAELARKKAERERILADQRADREYYTARTSAAREEQAPTAPKLLLRVRYDIGDGKKGRRPVEIEGDVSSVSLFHFYQRIEETFQIAPAQQKLQPADESKFPVQPREEALPSFQAFATIDDFPSLEALGVRNGQEFFLSLQGGGAEQPPTMASPSSAPAPTTAPAQASTPAPSRGRFSAAVAQAPAQAPVLVPVAAPSPTPVAKPAPARNAAVASATPLGPQFTDKARVKHLWMTVEQQRLNLTKEQHKRVAAEVDQVRRSSETARLAGLLLWDEKEVSFYAELKADLERTVGLQPVKEFIVQRLRDAAGRHVLKEGKQSHRHVLISGAFGVGKRYAADLISRLIALLNSSITAQVQVNSRVRLAAWQDPENRGALQSKNDLGTVVEKFDNNPTPFRVRGPSGREANYREHELIPEPELMITLSSLGDLLDPKTGKLRCPNGACFYLRLTAALSEADATILEGVLEAQSIVVMAGAPDVVEANLQLSAFRRRQPDILALPTLSPTDVARLIAMEVEKRGYAGVGEGDVGTTDLVTVLEHIIRQRFDEQLIREKNCHLAKDVLDLAITRKNDRTFADELHSDERKRLTPVDFGLDVLTAEQRERRLEEVELDIAALVGWGSEEEAGTPRHFFSTLRRQLQGKPGARSTATAAPLNMPRALWITANPGVGRETFARLAARFLRACGAISREEVVWVEGAELSAASDPVDLLTVRLGAATRGCIVVRDADLLVDSRDALRALASTLGGAEGGGVTLAILVGAPSGMARISRVEPGLEPRFPTRVAIPDLSATELVEFIEQNAGRLPSGALSLEEGLAPRLVEHINETYGGGVRGSELGENGNLSLARRLLQRAVQNRLTRLFNRIQEGEDIGGGADNESLTANDFEIGAPLGEGSEQKSAIDEEVGNIVGMGKAKEWFEQVRKKVAFVEQTGTKSDLRVCLNIIITGNPGTGKTTFARLLAKFFHTYGVLPKDSFVEKNGLELKAEFMGGTAPRVKAAVQEAMGGCLFLDEAYSLIDSSAGVGGSGDSFSQEALRTLLTEVENNRTNLMVVLAGYKEKMGRMMRAEEGLSRRFPSKLDLDDYTPKELASICEITARIRHQREFELGLCQKLETHIENFYWRDIATQNAGLAVNLTEQALDRQIVRLVSKYPQAFTVVTEAGKAPNKLHLHRQCSGDVIQKVKDEVAYFTAADFGIEERPTLGDPELRKAVQEEVDRLTGMANVKAFFEEMSRTVAFVERGGDPRVLQTSLNLRLTGNPGTGKTTVARLIGRFLYAHGVLPRDTFVERNALALKGQFVGQTAPTVVEAVRDAMGGCLFIDEAYALMDRGGDKFSGEVVRTLLTEVENHRTGLLVVLAGYADKMDFLMDSDPGLRRRFSMVLQLQDYSPDELADICEHAANDRFKLSFAPGLKALLAEHIRVVHGHEIAQHNGGLAVTLAERAFRKLATRLGDPLSDAAIGGMASRELLPEDFEISQHTDVQAAPPSSLSQASAAADALAAAGSSDAAALVRGSRRGGPEPQERRDRPAKRGRRPQLEEAVSLLARSLAAELLRGVQEEGEEDGLDEDMPTGGEPPAGPAGGSAHRAVAKAKGKERERPRETPKEEEQLPQKEGEKVIENTSTQEALDALGLCPASFEWYEINVADPPDENCGICNFKMSDGYRCGGGTHFVCMGCIDTYKVKHDC